MARATKTRTAFALAILASVLMWGCGGTGDEAKYTISGTITSGGAGIAGITVTLSGNGSGATVTDANGNYGFGNLEAGTYFVTPSSAAYLFTPSQRPAYLYGNSAVGFNFYASQHMQISTSTHTLYLKADGTVWAWGNNDRGQIGNAGAANPQLSPLQPGTLTDIIAVSAGDSFSLALKSDGTVWGWGDNSSGQLGTGAANPQPTPVQVAGVSGATAIAAGHDFSLALKSDGTAWAWGNGANGRLGNAGTSSSSSPVQVVIYTAVTSIRAGYDHAVAMDSSGYVWFWGANSQGQLCAGNTLDYPTPYALGVAGLDIAAGYQFSLYMIRNGLNSTVYACGANDSGQLGIGTTTASWSSAEIAPLTGLNNIALAAGRDHAMALNGDGTVWAWGANANGQIGNGTTSTQLAPVHLSGVSAIQGITAGYRDSFAQNRLSAVSAWGYNGYGQLGDGSTTDKTSPELISLP